MNQISAGSRLFMVLAIAPVLGALAILALRGRAMRPAEAH